MNITNMALPLRETYHLKVSEVPKFPFLDKWFDVRVSLTTDTGRLKTGLDVPLQIRMKCVDSDEYADHVLDIADSSSTKISSSGMTNIRCRILNGVSQYRERKFVMVATPIISDIHVIDAVTSSMMPIRHRLVINNIDEIPGVWFKDQGGRQKCIDIVVGLVGENSENITNRSIPIKIRLQYLGGESVVKQEILEVTRDSCMYIGATGRTELKVRINEVSMRHQGRCFCVVVTPDTLKDPTCSDVSPATTSGIEIRSKLVKSKRPLEEPMEQYSSPEERPTNLRKTAHIPTISPISLQPQILTPPRIISQDSFFRPPPVMFSHPPRNTTEWAQYVVNRLQHMRWEQIGSEIEPSGSHRPVYSMRNPNAIIDEILSSYSAMTGESIGATTLSVYSQEDGEGGTDIDCGWEEAESALRGNCRSDSDEESLGDEPPTAWNRNNSLFLGDLMN